MRMWQVVLFAGLAAFAVVSWNHREAVSPAKAYAAEEATDGPQLAILDTDIGDDIDDAFALALILSSPEVKLLGITADYGRTELRARLIDRYLKGAERSGIPVAAGRPTPQPNTFSQGAYAERQPERKHADAVAFLLDQIKAHPGQITLIAIGPLVNVGDAIRRDPAAFRRLKRVVMMGGSIDRGYDTATSTQTAPDAEWNIKRDPEGAKALFASGVPIYVMPLDSTQIHLDARERNRIFGFGSPVSDQLTLLYHEWLDKADNRQPDPTLYDPVAAAYAIRPDLCPMKPMRIEVDDQGFTRAVAGAPNAQVCLRSREKEFLDFLESRVTQAAH